MKIFEFNDLPTAPAVDTDTILQPGMYNAAEDEVTKAALNDTRKHVLTLKDLNRLKKLRAFRRLEALKDQDALALIYGQGEGEEDEGGF